MSSNKEEMGRVEYSEEKEDECMIVNLTRTELYIYPRELIIQVLMVILGLNM